MSDKTDLAETRTDWAEDRTVLALERTFTSWNGLGLGAVGIALALNAVFSATAVEWVPKLVASAFLVIAIAIYWIARHQAHRTYDRLNTHDTEAQTPRTFTWLALGLTIATLGVGGVLWRL